MDYPFSYYVYLNTYSADASLASATVASAVVAFFLERRVLAAFLATFSFNMFSL